MSKIISDYSIRPFVRTFEHFWSNLSYILLFFYLECLSKEGGLANTWRTSGRHMSAIDVGPVLVFTSEII